MTTRRRGSESRSVRSLGPDTCSIAAEPASDDGWGLDPVSASLEGRVESCEEVVEVCGDEAGGFGYSGVLAVHDEGHEEDGPGEILRGDLKDDEADATVAVILGEDVGKGEDEG